MEQQCTSGETVSRSQTLTGLCETTSQCKRGQWSVHMLCKVGGGRPIESI